MDIPAQSDPENDFEQILFQSVQERLCRKKSDGMGFCDAIVPVFLEMLEFSDMIVKDLEDSGQSPGVACKKGCTYCCHSQVTIIPIEALLISAFINTDFTGDEVTVLRAGISRIRSLTAGKTFEQIYEIKGDLPCLFLKEDTCSIYRMRPSICRSWNSFDSHICRAAYHSNNPASSIGSSAARNFVFGTTRSLFTGISEALTLQSGTLLLHNAVSDCLNSPDPMDRWATGHDLFRYG